MYHLLLVVPTCSNNNELNVRNNFKLNYKGTNYFFFKNRYLHFNSFHWVYEKGYYSTWTLNT